MGEVAQDESEWKLWFHWPCMRMTLSWEGATTVFPMLNSSSFAQHMKGSGPVVALFLIFPINCSVQDMNREVVKTDCATARIPELDFEIPAFSQKGGRYEI